MMPFASSSPSSVPSSAGIPSRCRLNCFCRRHRLPPQSGLVPALLLYSACLFLIVDAASGTPAAHQLQNSEQRNLVGDAADFQQQQQQQQLHAHRQKRDLQSGALLSRYGRAAVLSRYGKRSAGRGIGAANFEEAGPWLLCQQSPTTISEGQAAILRCRPYRI